MSANPKPFERFRTFLMFGAPGSGKGTQGKVLGTIPRFHHMACGDVFRSLDTRTSLGQEFVAFSSRGQLVPDETTVKLWRANIHDRVTTHNFKPDIDFLVLDGIPRNVEQAKFMEQDIDVVQVFHLSCPDRSELTRRLRKRALKENRFDDANEEVIAKRIRTYEEESKPILDYYSSGKYTGRNMVAEVDASQPPAKVVLDVLSRIMQLDVWKEREKVRV
ncbi:nucleoside monophosphate kinase [Roseimicrobium sp. ORNL1]|uniref:adenylate kinase family protein n=1 Tax=Roseimicrobium sp. ORNL1 TaxID=2711231 RepID=UPI0013E1B2DD|nr:nucleoside monophosphate kinase [Roseimicrobium sp. ORNL1]QIF05137.1 nucleoside monophosphate kinase [Roseimicrobium sp. ORNL1]